MSGGKATAKPAKPAKQGGIPAEWLLAFGAMLFIAIGLLVAIYIKFDGPSSGPPRPHYIGFKDLAVTGVAGRMEVSFDLQVSGEDVSRVSRDKRALESALQNDLRTHDPRSFYSRLGKERLAQLIQVSANTALEDDVVEAVYFGDFKIYER